MISGMAGIDKSIRDKIQNHSDTDTSSIHYDRYDYLAKKGLLRMIGTFEEYS